MRRSIIVVASLLALVVMPAAASAQGGLGAPDQRDRFTDEYAVEDFCGTGATVQVVENTVGNVWEGENTLKFTFRSHLTWTYGDRNIVEQDAGRVVSEGRVGVDLSRRPSKRDHQDRGTRQGSNATSGIWWRSARSRMVSATSRIAESPCRISQLSLIHATAVAKPTWCPARVSERSPRALRTMRRRRLHTPDPLLGVARVRCAHAVHEATKSVRCGVVGHCVSFSRRPTFDVRSPGVIPGYQSRFGPSPFCALGRFESDAAHVASPMVGTTRRWSSSRGSMSTRREAPTRLKPRT